MALPNLINAASPADADNPAAGAAQIRGLKQFLEDLFGLTDNTNYTVSPFSISTAGVLSGLLVGAGATSYGFPLVVNATPGANVNVAAFSSLGMAAGNQVSVGIGDPTAGNYASAIIRYTNGAGVAASSYLSLFNYGDNLGKALNVLGGGNVGVGTPAPALRFDVLESTGSLRAALFRRGVQTGAVDLSLPTGLGSPLVVCGGAEYQNGFYTTIGFGGSSGSGVTAYYPPIEVGSVMMNSAGYGYADFIIATRAGGTNSIPVERLRVAHDGSITIGGSFAVSGNATGVTSPITDIQNVNTTATAATVALSIGLTGASNMTNAQYIGFYDADGMASQNGSITAASATTVAYNQSSDRRLKQHIRDFTGALDLLATVLPRQFEWVKDGHTDYGFVAQELKAVYPYAVTGEETSKLMMGIDYGKLTPLLAAGVKELVAEMTALTVRVAALEAK